MAIGQVGAGAPPPAGTAAALQAIMADDRDRYNRYLRVTNDEVPDQISAGHTWNMVEATGLRTCACLSAGLLPAGTTPWWPFGSSSGASSPARPWLAAQTGWTCWWTGCSPRGSTRSPLLAILHSTRATMQRVLACTRGALVLVPRVRLCAGGYARVGLYV